jgi:hypothetical protein
MCSTIFSHVCRAHPDISFYLAPTTPRLRPQWFSFAQSEVSKQVQLQVHGQQARLLPLPGFQTDSTALDSDGVHFLPLPGRDYCIHLIESAR